MRKLYVLEQYSLNAATGGNDLQPHLRPATRSELLAAVGLDGIDVEELREGLVSTHGWPAAHLATPIHQAARRVLAALTASKEEG